jgi:Amt family ammonium transporter
VAIVGAFCLVTAFIILFVIKQTMGLRVSEKEEIEGLDDHEHGMSAYADYRMNDH